MYIFQFDSKEIRLIVYLFFLLRYTGWLCRGMVSATTYTLVGVVNKFFTVLLNVAVWDKHSSPWGLAAVCFCLLAGTFYQQVIVTL